MQNHFTIKQAEKKDIPLILHFIKALAEFEKLSHEVKATEKNLEATLFGEKSYAEVIFGYCNEKPVSFALYFHNYSTFLGKPGIYLEDLFVIPEVRGQGIGERMLSYLADLAIKRDCGRLEWWVLNWNEKAIRFYQKIGAKPQDEWTVFRLTEEALEALASKWQAHNF